MNFSGNAVTILKKLTKTGLKMLRKKYFEGVEKKSGREGMRI